MLPSELNLIYSSTTHPLHRTPISTACNHESQREVSMASDLSCIQFPIPRCEDIPQVVLRVVVGFGPVPAFRLEICVIRRRR
jgi:hypothetical protein